MKRVSIPLALALLAVTACEDSRAPTALAEHDLVASLTTTAVTYDCEAQTEIPETECDVLVVLYNSTDGPNWTDDTDWLETATPCGWYGVECFGGFVTQLRLNGNQLNGSIPPELGDLSHLYYLGLGDNQLSGSIPAELGNLSNLVSTHLFANQLSGPIPPELGNLSNLEGVQAIWNQLSGPIPAELGNLSKLKRLNLAYNQLSGAIPASLGNLSNLEDLGLQANQLTGVIPAELGNLNKLVALQLYSNQLTGQIPAALGGLSALQSMNLEWNQLSGPIPAALGNLSNLSDLNLISNQLSGPIPAALGNLGNLEQLWFYDNQLSGPIPAELGNLSKLKALVLHDNRLSGPIPAALGNLSSLEFLGLWHNQLSGLVPIEVASLGGSMPLSNNCHFIPGNGGLYMPKTQAYHDADLDDDGFICDLALSDFVVLAIDIKPGSEPNSVSLGALGRIPVAILSTDRFDAAAVDPGTVTLGDNYDDDTRVATRRNGSLMANLEDVDGDGDLDLLMHFEMQALVGNGDLDESTTQLIVNGGTAAGMPIRGSDTVRIVPWTKNHG